ERCPMRLPPSSPATTTPNSRKSSCASSSARCPARHHPRWRASRRWENERSGGNSTPRASTWNDATRWPISGRGGRKTGTSIIGGGGPGRAGAPGTRGNHVRTLAKILVVVAAVAPVAWSVTYMYWHLKINNAVRQLETETSVPDAYQFL